MATARALMHDRTRIGWPECVAARCRDDVCEIECNPEQLRDVCAWLHRDAKAAFGALIVEELRADWELRYVFYGAETLGMAHVIVRRPLADATFPSIVRQVHAADWHEREAEDLFGVHFDGHPRLGDFILHDDAWQEGLCPMRKGFDAVQALAHREPNANWRPRRIVHAPGAFAMPVGPVFSGVTESVHFLLETVGEDVIRAFPRLFYKYRAIEKTAEGRAVHDVLLLAERFAATTAFSHGLAFCHAVETICGATPPARARALRVLLAELERIRHHAGVIQEICESTGLVVAANQAAILEERLLRLSGFFTGHRYLFGLLAVGGLARDFGGHACVELIDEAREIVARMDHLETLLRTTSSFLDRLEEVGMIDEHRARDYGLVGPIARASGVTRDLRRIQPYGGYEAFAFEVPRENEGDGYARLRILFAEARQSLAVMEQVFLSMPDGPVGSTAALQPGAALGWTEAPRGAAFHWVRIGDDLNVERYRVVGPSFANWPGFHLAAEDFAFQDFPIILATFGLSVSETDR